MRTLKASEVEAWVQRPKPSLEDKTGFRLNDQPVGAVLLDGMYWWALEDVCEILRIEDIAAAEAKVPDNEKISVSKKDLNTGGDIATVFVNERELFKRRFEL